MKVLWNCTSANDDYPTLQYCNYTERITTIVDICKQNLNEILNYLNIIISTFYN